MDNIKWATDEQFKGIYTGKAALIIGRGNNKDYEPSRLIDNFDGIKIGCNTAYRVTPLDILIWLDNKVFTNNWQEIKELDCLKFGVNPINYRHNGVDLYGLQPGGGERCSDSFDAGFYPCELSGYIALNMALLLGCDQIYLHGFTSDMKDQYGTIRSDKFKYISDWIQKNDRKVYLTQKGAYLEKFFNCKALPKVSKKKYKNMYELPAFETVCIVGHGASIEGAGLGDLVDGHDCIVRMANCEWQENTKDYGHRYDYGIYCPDQEKYLENLDRFPKLAFWCYLPKSKRMMTKIIFKGINTFQFGGVIEDLRNNLNYFSRGTAAAIIAIKELKPKKLTLIGMDQVKTGRKQDKNHHPKALGETYGQKSYVHDWANEKKVIEQVSKKHKTRIEYLP